MTGWQPATKSRGPARKGAVVEIEPAERAVAVIQFGGLPAIDVQASNMTRFIATNYGSAGAKAPKKFKMVDGKMELRRAVKASGNEELDIVRDIASAAAALKKDIAKEKAVSLVLHGNDEGLSRIYRNGLLENMLNADQLRDVKDYRIELSRLFNEEARKQAALDGAIVSRKQEAIEDAKFYLRDVRERIDKFKASGPEANEMSEALERAAKAMEDAEVGALELQACNVGAIEGLASFSFADRLEHLLSTPTHPVRVKKHTRYVSTGVDSQTKKTMVWIGSNPRADGNELSATTLPPFVDTR